METLNLIWNFVYNYLEIIFLIIYGVLMIDFQNKYYIERRKNISLMGDIKLFKLAIDLRQEENKTLLDSKKFYKEELERKENELKEVREKRDKVYNKHGTQIVYFRKVVLAYKLAIAYTFKNNPAFIILLNEEFKAYKKQKTDVLRKLEKELEIKEN